MRRRKKKEENKKMRLRGGLVESMCVVIVLRESRFDR